MHTLRFNKPELDAILETSPIRSSQLWMFGYQKGQSPDIIVTQLMHAGSIESTTHDFRMGLTISQHIRPTGEASPQRAYGYRVFPELGRMDINLSEEYVTISTIFTLWESASALGDMAYIIIDGRVLAKYEDTAVYNLFLEELQTFAEDEDVIVIVTEELSQEATDASMTDHSVACRFNGPDVWARPGIATDRFDGIVIGFCGTSQEPDTLPWPSVDYYHCLAVTRLPNDEKPIDRVGYHRHRLGFNLNFGDVSFIPERISDMQFTQRSNKE